MHASCLRKGFRRVRGIVGATLAPMPYSRNDELPAPVREHLPRQAQDIFREAFNHAYTEYAADEPRAFRVAWAAVKRRFEKHGTQWVAKS